MLPAESVFHTRDVPTEMLTAAPVIWIQGPLETAGRKKICLPRPLESAVVLATQTVPSAATEMSLAVCPETGANADPFQRKIDPAAVATQAFPSGPTAIRLAQPDRWTQVLPER